MSDTETLWKAVQGKWPVPLKDWNKLSQQSQMMIMQVINTMVHVCQMEQK